ncbi:hypothetical protein HYFRA_00008505 [Hymenoscyphus fraxineus]|uniref:Uncharacterized protein n=1 Tax=Hymenoscyphus fraxineus TaxID=746836 RepID=A0A9N9KV25_9HELO|nr:hypothetical protein HYFRA_00008505 [Hymenoscyphus fraxineus]
MSSKYNHAPWRKAILIPFWVVQIIFLCIMIGTLTLAMIGLATLDSYRGGSKELDAFNDLNRGEVDRALHIIIPIFFAISSYSLITVVVEIVLLALHRLKPAVFTALSGINTAIWTVMLALKIPVGGVNTQQAGAIAINVILALSFLVPFIYGCTVCCRVRKSKKAHTEGSTSLSENDSSPQYSNLTSRDIHDEENFPLAVDRPSYKNTRYTRAEDFRGDHSISPYHGAYGQDSFITNHPSPHPPTINIQHDGANGYEMGSGRKGEIR